MSINIGSYTKAVLAGAAAALATAQASLVGDGTLSLSEWLQVAGAFVAAAGVVYIAPNAPASSKKDVRGAPGAEPNAAPVQGPPVDPEPADDPGEVHAPEPDEVDPGDQPNNQPDLTMDEVLPDDTA